MSPRIVRIIRPTEKRWFVDGSDISFLGQVATSRNSCVFAATLHGGEYDYYDATVPYSRIFKFVSGKWSCIEISARIVDIIRYKETSWRENGIAILTETGDFWVLGQTDLAERIYPERASLMDGIFQFEKSIYATGFGGQLYLRKDASWYPDDLGMYDAEPAVPRPRPNDHGAGSFSNNKLAITPDGTNAFAGGNAYNARPSLFWRSQGCEWRWLGIDPSDASLDQIYINDVYADANSGVWISTNKGFLLSGSVKGGFKKATNVARKADGTPINFSNIVEFMGRLYIGGSAACVLLDDGNFEQLSAPAYISMSDPQKLETKVSGRLSVVDNVLWAIGYGILSRFDGTVWERFVMPSVYRKK